MPRIPILIAALAFTVPTLAADTLPPGAKVTKLAVLPAAVELTGPVDYAQITVTATLDTGETMDVTRLVTVELPPVVAGPTSAPVIAAGSLFTGTRQPAAAFVSVSPTGMIRPTADGKGALSVTVAGQSATLPVGVTGFAANKPISFTTDVHPVLSKLGCNAGTCHGAAAGKAGLTMYM